MHRINRRQWLVQSGALCLAGGTLPSLSAASTGPLRSEFRLYRVRVDGASPLRLNRANLAISAPPGNLTACMSDLAPGWDGRAHFLTAVKERLNSIRSCDGSLLYWFCAFLQRGDVVLCYDDSDTCRVAAVAGGYSFNANDPGTHVRPLAWFPATIPRQTLRPAFMSERPTRALHEVSRPRCWGDTDALSAVEAVIDARLQNRAATGLGHQCSRRLESPSR